MIRPSLLASTPGRLGTSRQISPEVMVLLFI
jgi:hypothetical protein